jgi:hypothetical protein
VGRRTAGATARGLTPPGHLRPAAYQGHRGARVPSSARTSGPSTNAAARCARGPASRHPPTGRSRGGCTSIAATSTATPRSWPRPVPPRPTAPRRGALVPCRRDGLQGSSAASPTRTNGAQ